jgi:hypothetical protein
MDFREGLRHQQELTASVMEQAAQVAGRLECPVCGNSEYSEPDLPHHLGIHQPIKVVATPIAENSWVFRRDDGREAGPFGPNDMADPGFESQVARQLRVRPGDVFSAKPSSPLVARIRHRDIDASKISWSNEYLFEGQIVGESERKAVPRTVTVYCPACKARETISLGLEPQAALVLEGLAGFQRRLGDSLQDPSPSEKSSPCHHTSAVILDQSEFSDYRLVKLRPLPAADDNLDFTDFRSVKVYCLGHRLPESKAVRVRARVLVESKTKDIVLLATETLPLEDEISSFQLTPEDRTNFAKYYTPSVFEEVDGFFITRMVGQTLRKQLMQLVLHSPVWIRLPDNTRIRGLLRMLLVGDTKTYKSKGLMWIPERLRLGEIIFGETSSRTGLLYTIDSENRMLIWGALPRNDLGLCLIAGLHGVSADEMTQFREVLEFLRVKVTRMVDGEAHCRCRIIADSNPRRDSMREYLLPCEAIRDLPFFRSSPDVTRWDFYFISRREDVDQEEIDNAVESDPTIPFNVQRRHILWAQSRRMENIQFDEGVLEAVNKLNAELVKTYGSESLPIVHSGFRESVIRSSVAMAATLHSVDDSGEKVAVKLIHVEKVQALLTWLFDNNLELDRYVNAEREKTVLLDEDLETLVRDAGDAIDVLIQLRGGAMQSGVLAEKLGRAPSTVREHATRLKAIELMRSSRGRAGGYELTTKGVAVLRRMMPKDRTENDGKTGAMTVDSHTPRNQPAFQTGGTPISDVKAPENPTLPRKAPLFNHDSVEERKNYPCEVCGKPAMPISRIGEEGVRAFCSEHLTTYTGAL